jgi:alkaline phosphatase
MFTGTRARILTVALVALAATLALSCGGDESANSDKSAGTSARSVILLIGDGMGMAHRTAGRLYAVGRGGRLAMDTLPVEGAARTWSTESVVTDSAAAGTALATGVKTLNKAVAVDPEGKSVPTVLEMAKSAGKSTGLVTTVFLTDATPAAFAAHNADRRDYLDIATDMFDHNVDVLLGGGEKYFLPAGASGCFPNDNARTDGRNLVEEAVAEGYKHVCTENDLNSVSADSTDKLFGTFAADSMTRPYAPSLADMAKKAIDVLDKNPSGFFLMVEGGQIDVAAHVNNALGTLADVVSFDAAVQVALAYQKDHPETLVIVTADHSTGGLTIEDAPQDGPCPQPNSSDPRECDTLLHEDGPFPESMGGSFWLDWTSNNHTADDVPVMATGPDSQALAGDYENTHIFEVMRDALGLAQ